MLAALVNAVALIVIAVYIFWEAWHRLQEPPEIKTGPLLIVAIAGLIANAASAWILSRGHGAPREPQHARRVSPRFRRSLRSAATIVAAIVIYLPVGTPPIRFCRR